MAMQLLKNVLADRLCPRLFVTKLTRKEDMLDLIGALKPVTTEHPLIRLGPADDGGYLVPDDLQGINACFSPGVSTSSDFELACAKRGMQIYLADYSVDGPATEHEHFHFIKKFVGSTTSQAVMTMDDWARSSQPNDTSDLLLQMDIEGCEYETLLSTSDDFLKRCRVIVIEFHRLHELWSRPYFRLASMAFRKLLQTHACVHLHPNNCRSAVRLQGLDMPRVMEFTFLRRDRFTESSPATQFPHLQDADNTDRPPLVLPQWWYGE